MKRVGCKPAGHRHWYSNNTSVFGPIVEIYATEPTDTPDVPGSKYEIEGWILPGDATGGGGLIYATHDEAGRNSILVYTKRPEDPMNVTRSEFDTLAAEVVKLNEWTVAAGKSLHAHFMMIASHASVIDTVRGHRLGPNDTRAADWVTLPKETNDRLAALESICRPDLVTRGVFSEGAARRAVIDREVTEAHRMQSDAMTFYDHAFIAAYTADEDGGDWDGRAKRAHQVAKFMTEARRPQPDA